jgi:hypothetical protein
MRYLGHKTAMLVEARASVREHLRLELRAPPAEALHVLQMFILLIIEAPNWSKNIPIERPT